MWLKPDHECPYWSSIGQINFATGNFYFIVTLFIWESLILGRRDKRVSIYPECMQGSDLTLWCDYSNYTTIPDPDHIYQVKSCRNTLQLIVNDSCIQELTEGKSPIYSWALSYLKSQCVLMNFIPTPQSVVTNSIPRFRRVDSPQHTSREKELHFQNERSWYPYCPPIFKYDKG